MYSFRFSYCAAKVPRIRKHLTFIIFYYSMLFYDLIFDYICRNVILDFRANLRPSTYCYDPRHFTLELDSRPLVKLVVHLFIYDKCEHFQQICLEKLENFNSSILTY